MRFVLATTARPSLLNNRGFSLLALTLLMACSALATLVPRMSLEEVIDASETIVHGNVVRTWADWDADHKYIWTHYEIQVVDKLKGNVVSTIVVSEPGGTVGDTALQVAGTPRYEVGEEVVLFAEKTPLGYLRTCGWGQGKFRVQRARETGKVTVRTAAKGIQLVEPPARESKAAGTPLGEMNGQELEQFKTRVRQIIEKRAGSTR